MGNKGNMGISIRIPFGHWNNELTPKSQKKEKKKNCHEDTKTPRYTKNT